MIDASRPLRAAQYVRMSTEHQQYSTDNQKDAIGAYAKANGIEVVRTYEDAGKSGLTLVGRPSLRRLIADVVAGQDDFDTILVYDVSRWGRFQDADESAHLEYMCRLAGVHVEYCAEPFSNDGTPFSNICKVVKRALAAEYSRELSDKVYIGKQRLIKLGFRQGGSPGFGLRRCLVDQSGARKQLLARGQLKSIATDRIILVPGPPSEVAVVRRMYRDYVKGDVGFDTIADRLNRKGIRSESGRPWSASVVMRVLSSEKYVGDSVWGRDSFKLKIKRHRNAPETWVRFNGAFEGIVRRSLFEKAKRVRAARSKLLNEEELDELLRKILRNHGVITTRLINESGVIKTSAVRKRFGSLIRAYARVGYRPTRCLDFISFDGAARRLRATTTQTIIDGVRSRGGIIERVGRGCRYLVNGEMKVSVTVAQERRSYHGSSRWRIKLGGSTDDLTVAVLMDGTQEKAYAYYFFPATELGNGPLIAPQNPANIEVFRSNSLEPLFRLCTRCEPGSQDAPQLVAPDVAQQNPSSDPRARKGTKVRPRGFRSTAKKSFTGAFLRVSKKLRVAIKRADDTRMRLNDLRQLLAELLSQSRFARLLAQQRIETVPLSAFPDEAALGEQDEKFRANLRKQARELLSGGITNKRARYELEKLTASRRLEAAECMVLAGSCAEYFAAALVAATPNARLAHPRPAPVNAARSEPRFKELATFVEEGDFIYSEAKRALAVFGWNALDLMALSAFVRRLLANKRVVEWLERNDAVALRCLQTMSN